MLKKTITYVDYDDNQRTEDHYFHLTESELMMLEASELGGFRNKLIRLNQSQDGPEILKVFRELIRASYGVKSPDGKRFIKSKELCDEFEQTEAFNVLFMELFKDPKAFAEFFAQLLPKKFRDEAMKEMQKNLEALPEISVVE